MTYGLGQRIFERELATTLSRRRAYRDLYGDINLVKELDIVNELDGHSGCVNALSWSRSGRLLASGSDDQHLNIHTYQPDDFDKQFQLHTTVATGHTQNIFSVKFMPQSNDRTVVTCAGDGEVRVFDLEYAGQTTEASNASARASAGRRARRNNLYNGVRYLSDGDTDARVYRSHGDRVKRIVTEQSPYLFLTCSEDGEVRQWDTRQPSSAYPKAGARFGSRDDRPPPLISYQRYELDLNTISCAASQPHYIALGGAHLHCFLHDRRMTGRDLMQEQGRAGASPQSNDDEMNEATRCVKKFAPQGQPKMSSDARGHITACKISEARPDEMIVSWSADHIYSFDLIRSPDAGDNRTTPSLLSTDKRKRKRQTNGSKTSLSQKPATKSRSDKETVVRVNYQNGQSEDIMLEDAEEQLNPEQLRAQKIVKAFLHIRKTFFGPANPGSGTDARWSRTLCQCAFHLEEIDDVLREWTYPLEATQDQVMLHQRMRSVRESIRRVVQAAGTISRVLGAVLKTTDGISPMMANFLTIDNRTSDLQLCKHDQLCYDLMKAILVWLDSGRGKLIEVFTRPTNMSKTSKAGMRLPIPENQADAEAFEEWLIPYLTLLAEEVADDGKFVLDPESNQFETDEARTMFGDAEDVVHSFAQAAARPFADLLTAAHGEEALDRNKAKQFWALRVCRGILLRLTNRISIELAECAFGGKQTIPEAILREAEEPTNTDEEDVEIEDIEVLDETTDATDNGSAPLSNLTSTPAQEESYLMDEDTIDNDDDDNDYETMEEGDDDEEDEEDSSEPDEVDGVPNVGFTSFLHQTTAQRHRRHIRTQVGKGVPCDAAIRTYKGHCNVRTVKDVNYFGLEDEYVVSGSDDGNLFIWDRKTSQLVNILEGDGEVVNVVQGHPYETMLAVSGIDHTIKIFSPDNHAREVARLGQGVSAHDPSTFSSLQWPARYGSRTHRSSHGSHTATTSEPAVPAALSDYEDDSYVAEHGLNSRRRLHQVADILDRNNVDRRRGDDDAVMTRSMLNILAQRMRQHRAAHGGIPEIPLDALETDEEGRVRVVLGEDCVVM